MSDIGEGWTARDSVLHATCEIAADVIGGRLHERPRLAHSFALQFSNEERLLATGGYQLLWWGALGDGTWEKRTTIVGGTGIVGIGLLGATALGSAMGNAGRRSQAANDATPMWRPADTGALHVSDHGFYLHGPLGFRPFAWVHVLEADLTAQTQMTFNAQTTSGSEQFCLTSDWSELVFLLWALHRNRYHPRLVDGTWIDPAFFDKCRRHEYGVRRPMLGS